MAVHLRVVMVVGSVANEKNQQRGGLHQNSSLDQPDSSLRQADLHQRFIINAIAPAQLQPAQECYQIKHEQTRRYCLTLLLPTFEENYKMNSTHVLTPPARLQFLTGWQTIQHGNITQGGKLVIDYDPQRLSNIRREWHDAVVWNIEAEVRFHPGGQQFRESVLEPIYANEGRGPVRDYSPKPLEIHVPNDATRLDLWFHSWSVYLEGWDSQFGQNYWFDVVQAPTV